LDGGVGDEHAYDLVGAVLELCFDVCEALLVEGDGAWAGVPTGWFWAECATAVRYLNQVIVGKLLSVLILHSSA